MRYPTAPILGRKFCAQCEPLGWAVCVWALTVVVLGCGRDEVGGRTDEQVDVAPAPEPSAPAVTEKPDPIRFGTDTADIPPLKFVKALEQVEKYANGAVKAKTIVHLLSDNSHIRYGQHVEYAEGGQVLVQGNHTNNVRHGPWEFYWPNGTKCKTVQYENGLLNGGWEIFGPDGTRESQESYQKQKRHGMWRTYDDSGEQVLRQMEYHEGLRQGTWTTWYPTGQKESEVNYDQNRLNGRAMIWDENGETIQQIEYRDDQPVGKGGDTS